MNSYAAYHVLRGGVDPSGLRRAESDGVGPEARIAQDADVADRQNISLQEARRAREQREAEIAVAEIQRERRIREEARANRARALGNFASAICDPVAETWHLIRETPDNVIDITVGAPQVDGSMLLVDEAIRDAGHDASENWDVAGSRIVTLGLLGKEPGPSRVNVGDEYYNRQVSIFLMEFGASGLLGGMFDSVVAVGPPSRLHFLRQAPGPVRARGTYTLGELSSAEIDRFTNNLGQFSTTYLGDQRLSPADLRRLTAITNDEYALYYIAGTGRKGGGGCYFLSRGRGSFARIPLDNDVFLIYHTHTRRTLGTPAHTNPSTRDRRWLFRMRKEYQSPQRSSEIVPQDGPPIRFTE
ncbi:MAG: hypothetical protein AAGH88_00035 [Planctomycetota bacterium]